MKNSFENFNKKADPTKSSPVFREKALEFTHEEVIHKEDRADSFTREIAAFIDNEGEKFYKLNKEEPEQFIMTKLLKGVINVSDILIQDGEYYSRELNLEDIEEKTGSEERLVDHTILLHLFEEGDHHSQNGEEHNMQNKEGKRVLYDFHTGTVPDDKSKSLYSLSLALSEGQEKNEIAEYNSNIFRELLLQKLDILESRISPEFIKEIYKLLPQEDIYLGYEKTIDQQADDISESLLLRISNLRTELETQT